jgi:hypothetical protein
MKELSFNMKPDSDSEAQEFERTANFNAGSESNNSIDTSKLIEIHD